MDLVSPALQYIASYGAALRRDWSPNTTDAQAGKRELSAIEADPDAFIAGLSQREVGGMIVLPDGSQVPRMPGFRRWMWDGEFCGSIGLRWQPGTNELPPYVLGHIGYTVVPWKQRRGYATAALQQMLALARLEGLAFVYVTTRPDNRASQHVIEKNLGVLLGKFPLPPQYGAGSELKYRIDLQ